MSTSRNRGTTVADTTVPSFGYDELQGGPRSAQLRRCLAEQGVFYLREEAEWEAEHRRAYAALMDFFVDATEEERAAVTNPSPRSRRGYSKLESESTAQVTSTGDYADYSMAYSMGVADNLFPSPELEAVMVRYFDRMYRAARDVAGLVLAAADADVEGGVERLLDCDPVLRFRYFPEVPEHRCAEHQPLRMASHYDLSIVTLIHQRPCANGFVSLQCEEGGGFVDLPFVPGTSIIVGGAVGTLVTDGRVKAPKHRVRAPGIADRFGSSRTSAVFFLRPNPEFRFSVSAARALGFDVSLGGETATFRDWIGGNYANLGATAVAP